MHELRPHCYKNPHCRQEQRTGATLVVRQLVRARILRTLALFPLEFCSVGSALLLWNSIHWPIIVCLPFISSDQSVTTFLIWKCPLPNWFSLSSLSFYGRYLLLIGLFTFLFPD